MNDPRKDPPIILWVFFVLILCFSMLWVIVDNADYIDGTARHQGQKK